ncbi:MAG: homocysteine S-methyltransferase family protein [Firmicutes bacterium]|nr:homocysteine S-methyltransferase family protein [Bacillota bacterium]MCM1401525.1 homocysteine S-methyltransferase family protein [Bacteroides sp.]MCM1477375.1 homocysteine S-methyltransferase family protein [Bacteroides sp.]
MTFTQAIEQDGRLLLDGATGTCLLPNGIIGLETTGATCDQLCLTAPRRVELLHKQYIEAGADVITTNTFNLPDPAVCRAAVTIARNAMAAAGRKVFIAGNLGPGGPRGRVSQAVEAFVDSGVDLLILESIYSLNHLITAIPAIKQAGLPTVICATPLLNGMLPSGESLQRFIELSCEAQAAVMGLNCGYGPAHLASALSALNGLKMPLAVMPSAGLPEQGYLNAQYFASECHTLISNPAVKLVGGCCGTTPAHITALRAMIDANNCKTEQ